MRSRASVVGWTSVSLATLGLWATVAASACAGSAAERRPAGAAQHVEVDADLESCDTCHAQATPAVVAEWREGRHGLSLVQCVVCHGSTGRDFTARPGVAGCQGCHPQEAASVARAATSKRCFDCHAGHSLKAQGPSPHGVEP